LLINLTATSGGFPVPGYRNRYGSEHTAGAARSARWF